MMLASKVQPVSVSACENITSSVDLVFCENASLSKRSAIKVVRIGKISIASLKDIVVLTQFSRDYTVDRKNEASARRKFLVFVRA